MPCSQLNYAKNTTTCNIWQETRTKNDTKFSPQHSTYTKVVCSSEHSDRLGLALIPMLSIADWIKDSCI